MERTAGLALPRDGDRCDTARLGNSDCAGPSVATAMQDLGELGALSGSGLADDHDHRVFFHGLYDLLLELVDGEDGHGRGGWGAGSPPVSTCYRSKEKEGFR